MAIADPSVGTLFAASLAVVVGEGHAPVVAVLVRAVRQTSPSRTLKDANHGHPRTFPCITAVYGDRWEGAIIAILDPWQADAVMGGEGDAPVAAVLFASAKAR